MDNSISLIFKYITEIEKERNSDNVLLLFSKMASDLLHCDRCTIWMLDDENNTFWTKIAHGLEDKIVVSADKGTIALAKKENKSYIINDTSSNNWFNPEIDDKTGYKTKNIIVVPIRNLDNEVIGVYQAINKIDGDFNENDINFLKLIAGYSAEIIDSAILYKEIEDTQKEIIFRIGDIAEAKSKETGNHIKRVAEYSAILATNYGLTKKEIDLIVLGSPMHDLGKIAIPDEILHKPGKLTSEEFEIIKTHAKIGYDLLKFSRRKILKAASIIAYEHHEKWNGKGYPRGLANNNIHIYGRILAIADVFDALISDRCYRKAWPIDKVINLIKEERGNHFDPDLVDIFFDHLNDFISVKEHNEDKFTSTELKAVK